MKNRKYRPDLRLILEFCSFLAVLAAWLVRPETVATGVRNGLLRCARVIIPSLFPFFVLSGLFVRRGYHRFVAGALCRLMQPAFGLPPEAAGALAMGTVGGYPIGAATAFSLHERGFLTARQTSHLLSFCNNAGPGFIFGVIGLSLLGDARLGAVLFAVHLLSAAAVGIISTARGSKQDTLPTNPAANEAPSREPFSVSFVESVRSAALTMLQVCAFLVFFSVLLPFVQLLPPWTVAARLLQRLFGLDAAAAGALLSGAVELSAGIAGLQDSGCSVQALQICSAFLLGWGGLCVHCQVLSLRKTTDISMQGYFAGKFFQGILSAAAVWLLVNDLGWILLLFPVFCVLGIRILAFSRKASGKTTKSHV